MLPPRVHGPPLGPGTAERTSTGLLEARISRTLRTAGSLSGRRDQEARATTGIAMMCRPPSGSESVARMELARRQIAAHPGGTIGAIEGEGGEFVHPDPIPKAAPLKCDQCHLHPALLHCT